MTHTETIIAKIREVCTELTKQLTSLIVTIRIVLALPFVIVGAALMMLAEVVSGRILLYNSDKLQCSKCGHKSEGIIELIRHQPKK